MSGSFLLHNITVMLQQESKLSVKVGNDELSPWTCSSQICDLHNDQTGLKVSGNGEKVTFAIPSSSSSTRSNQEQIMRVNLQRMHERYFDVHVSGLGTFAKIWGVGGILGDSGADFSQWTSLPEECSQDSTLSLLSESMLGGSMISATRDA